MEVIDVWCCAQDADWLYEYVKLLIIQNDVLDYSLHAGWSILNHQKFAKWTFFQILHVWLVSPLQ